MNKNINLKGIKELLLKKEGLLILFLVGLILLVIAIPTEEQISEKETDVIHNEAYENDNDYCAQLEQRLEDILSYIEGVGKVKVMITLVDSGKNVVEKDVSSKEVTQEEVNEVVREEETVYTETEEGTLPYVVNTYRPKIQGVLVVAQGADNPLIKQEIMEGVMALFEVESHKINIINME